MPGSHLGRPTPRLLLRLGVILVYPGCVFCYDVPNAFLHVSAPVHPTRFCSSLRLWSTHRAQRFHTPRQSRRMRVRLPDEIFMTSCVSVYAIFESSLIRDSTLETFYWGNGRCHSTTTAIVFQRSRSRYELCDPPENSGSGR